MVRLYSDGTEDTAFYANLGTAFNNPIYAVAYKQNLPNPTPTPTPITPTPTPTPITPTPTPTPTTTPTPTSTPPPLLTFLITSGQSEYDACNGVSGTIYASDIGNCGGCYSAGLNCLACLDTVQGIYINPERTILAPNAYYANEMSPGNFAIIEVRNGSEVASGFQGGCPGSPPSPPTGAHPYMFTGYSANTIVSSYCDAYTGGTPCTLYGDYTKVDENTYLYNVSSGSSTTNLFGSYSMRQNDGGTGGFVCFYLDSDGQNTSNYQTCSSSC
jgi:Fe-S cluster biogenesis protein NfuA